MELKIINVNDIVVVGAEHMETRFFNLIADVDAMLPGYIKKIVLDGNNGLRKFAFLDPANGTITLDLLHHFEDTIESSVEADSVISIRGELWFSLMVSIFHEMVHLIELGNDPNAYPNGETEDIDDATTRKAEDLLAKFIQKGYPVEPPLAWEMPFFAPLFAKIYHDMKEMPGNWARNQLYMHESGIMKHTAVGYKMTLKETLIENLRIRIHKKEEEKMRQFATGLEDGTMYEDLDALESMDEEPENGESETGEEMVGEEMVIEDDDDYIPPAEVVVGTTNAVPVPPPPTLFSTTPVPQETPVPPAGMTFMPNTMDPNAVSAIAQMVYVRLFNHIFTNCGWTGLGFDNLVAVRQGVNINDIPGAREIFWSMDTEDTRGQKLKNLPSAGVIAGEIFNTAKLPGYTLHMVVGNVVIERRLVPQNPNKTDGSGALSRTAQLARAGHRIMWIINTEAESNDKKFIAKIENGTFSMTTPR